MRSRSRDSRGTCTRSARSSASSLQAASGERWPRTGQSSRVSGQYPGAAAGTSTDAPRDPRPTGTSRRSLRVRRRAPRGSAISRRTARPSLVCGRHVQLAVHAGEPRTVEEDHTGRDQLHDPERDENCLADRDLELAAPRGLPRERGARSEGRRPRGEQTHLRTLPSPLRSASSLNPIPRTQNAHDGSSDRRTAAAGRRLRAARSGLPR